MMTIGILGYGKMGKVVESQAVVRGHDVKVLNVKDLSPDDLSGVDCAIDFSHASVAPDAIEICLRQGVNVVSGTTGWNDGLASLKDLAASTGTAFCWAPNFSVGMNIAFHMNKVLADIMDKFDVYSPQMLEVHHVSKKDSPSGTAIALAEQIIDRIDRVQSWKLTDSTADPSVLPITARREEDVKGIHRVVYSSDIDTISLRHHALSRDGFALGSVIAAEHIAGKSGFVSFEEVMNLKAT